YIHLVTDHPSQRAPLTTTQRHPPSRTTHSRTTPHSTATTDLNILALTRRINIATFFMPRTFSFIRAKLVVTEIRKEFQIQCWKLWQADCRSSRPSMAGFPKQSKMA